MNMEEFRNRFASAIASAKSPMERFELIAKVFGEYFGVKSDEVAIFSLDRDREVLVFVWPGSLKSVGSIPLNAHRCLVSKTAVETKASIDNTFATTPHLYMFEHFLANKETRIPIQKIMSVPVLDSNQLKGVVQVARKGVDRESAGEDFKPADLEALTGFAGIIAPYI